MLLSIKKNEEKEIILDLSILAFLNVVGVPDGLLGIHAGAYPEKGIIESMKWEHSPLGQRGTITIALKKAGIHTKPVEVTRKKIDEILKMVKKLSGKKYKYDEGFDSNEKKMDRPMVNRKIKVLKNKKDVFEFEGEHIQFEIDWREGDECQLSVWGQKSYDSIEKEYYTVLLNTDTVYLFYESNSQVVL